MEESTRTKKATERRNKPRVKKGHSRCTGSWSTATQGNLGNDKDDKMIRMIEGNEEHWKTFVFVLEGNDIEVEQNMQSYFEFV